MKEPCICSIMNVRNSVLVAILFWISEKNYRLSQKLKRTKTEIVEIAFKQWETMLVFSSNVHSIIYGVVALSKEKGKFERWRILTLFLSNRNHFTWALASHMPHNASQKHPQSSIDWGEGCWEVWFESRIAFASLRFLVELPTRHL